MINRNRGWHIRLRKGLLGDSLLDSSDVGIKCLRSVTCCRKYDLLLDYTEGEEVYYNLEGARSLISTSFRVQQYRKIAELVPAI
jgi:hypothetical protein